MQKTKPIILVTGFEAFANHPVNPTEVYVRRLENKRFKNFILKTKILPVEYHRSQALLLETMKKLNPDFVLCLGLAARRKTVQIEIRAKNKIGVNLDNRGYCPKLKKVKSNGPNYLSSTLPIKRLIKTAKTKKISLKTSMSAGDYVCNWLMYHLLWSTLKKPTQAGFVHFPNATGHLKTLKFILEELSRSNS